MKAFKQLLFLINLLILSLKLSAQDPVMDSLKAALKNAKHDTVRCTILSEMTKVENDDKVWSVYNDQLLKLAEKGATTSSLKLFYLKHLAGALNNIGLLAKQQGDNPKALEYSYRSLKIQEEIKDKAGMATSLNNIGSIYYNQGGIPRALEYYHKSLKIHEEINDKEGIARSLNNMGLIYNHQGDIPRALEYYHKSLKILEEIKDKNGIAYSLNNIGFIYNNQGDIPKALEYYHKSLKFQEEIRNKKGIATSLNNIGGIYKNQGDFPKALECYHKSLKIREEIKDKQGIATSLNSIGLIYNKEAELLPSPGSTRHRERFLNKALEYYHKSLKISEELKDKRGIANSLNNIASAMLESESPDSYQKGGAFAFATRGLQTAKELGYPENIRNAATVLKKIYEKQGMFKEALIMYELEMQMRDSINNAETKKASIRKQFQYQYEKKAAADSVKNAEEQKVKNAQLTAQQAQLKQEKVQRYSLYGGLLLVILFSIFIFNRFQITKRQKVIIEDQKVLVDKAYETLHEKNKEVMDSIRYALRIQRSLLTNEVYIIKALDRLRTK